MSLAQYNGANVGNKEVVYYSGTGTLTVGQMVAFSTDPTANPDTIPAGSLVVPPTSNVLPRNLRGREVTDLSATNFGLIAGVVGEGSGIVGPGWIDVQKLVKGDIIDVYSNANATVNATILGASSSVTNTVISLGAVGTNGTYSNFVNGALIALETIDRSSTNGLIRALVL